MHWKKPEGKLEEYCIENKAKCVSEGVIIYI